MQRIRTERQRGAALIVGLVLMTVLTLLAVSTMRTSTLELAMAGNLQFHEQSVQIAETGVRDALRRINNNILAPLAIPDWNTLVTAPVIVNGVTLGSYDVTISFEDCGEPPEGSQGSDYKAEFYEIRSTGTSVARNARSTIVRGFWMPALACPATGGQTT